STPDPAPDTDSAPRSGSPTARPTAAPDPNPTRPGASTSGTGTPAPPRDAAGQASLDERLRAAAWADDVAGARRLLRRGADPNAEDATQQSAYLIATSEGHLELLELVLRHGG